MRYKITNKELGSKSKEKNGAVTEQQKLNASVPDPSAEEHLRHTNRTTPGKNTILNCIFNLILQ